MSTPNTSLPPFFTELANCIIFGDALSVVSMFLPPEWPLWSQNSREQNL